LKLWYGVGSILSAERRNGLIDTMDQNPEADVVRADDYLMVDLKGTRVPVRMVAAMKAQGASTAEIVDGYPSVTARMVELAEIWSAAHPARAAAEAF